MDVPHVHEEPFARASKFEGMLSSDAMMRKSRSELEAMLDGAGKEWARLMSEENGVIMPMRI